MVFTRVSLLKNLLKLPTYGSRRTVKNPSYLLRMIQIPFFSISMVNFICIAKAEPLKQFGNSKSSNEAQRKFTPQSLIKESDELFAIGKFKESAQALEPFKDSNNVEVLWRLARSIYNMSKQKDLPKSENASLIKEAFEYIERALELDNNHYAVHKWMAILYDAKCALEGIKARINALPIFREHLLKAIELNPKDATSIYILGQYMYNIADMSRLQRIIAKTLFGDPPEATFEEAFYYFTKAEEVEPNFYSANLLMLGKTSLKLNRIETGRYWLKCAVAYPVRTDEDEAVRLEAEELLKKYPEVEKKVKEQEAKNVQ